MGMVYKPMIKVANTAPKSAPAIVRQSRHALKNAFREAVGVPPKLNLGIKLVLVSLFSIGLPHLSANP